MKIRKNAKGVMTIFLLFIFTSTYVLSGLLVDGGRIRMATALAESSLDNSMSSGLSYYDRKLYEEYGIFAMSDIQKSKEIAKATFEETMMQKKQCDEAKRIYFDGYNFDIDNINIDSSLNIGMTDITKAQILDHMRYRAPLQLINKDYGILSTISKLESIKNRFVATKNKIEIIQKYENVFEQGQKIIDDKMTLIEKLKDFSKTPIKSKIDTISDGTVDSFNLNFQKEFKNRKKSYYDVIDKIKNLENVRAYSENDIKVLIDKYNNNTLQNYKKDILDNVSEDIQEIEDEIERKEKEDIEVDQKLRDKLEDLNNLKEYEEEKLDKAKDIAILIKCFEDTYDEFLKNMKDYKNEVNNLREKIKSYEQSMNSYIKELESKFEEHKDDEDYKTVYLPDIEIAKGLRAEAILEYEKFKMIELSLSYESNENSKKELYKEVKNSAYKDKNIVISNYTFIKDINFKLERLSDILKNIKIDEKKDYKENKKKIENENKKKKDEKEKEQKEKERKLKEDIDDLSQYFDGAVDIGIEEYEEILNISNADDTLNDAKAKIDSSINLIDSILKILKEARDEIFINEYVLLDFRNIVHHKSMDAKNDGQSASIIKGTKYETIIAKKFKDGENRGNTGLINSEVEFILYGKNNPNDNIKITIAAISALRLAMNLVGLMSDPNMIYQAQALSTIAGPFAPVAFIGIVVTWAGIETATDLINILDGQKVLFLKRGKDWNLSEEGAIKIALENIYNDVENTVDYAFNSAYKNISTKINSTINDVIDTGKNNMNTAFNQLKNNEDVKKYSIDNEINNFEKKLNEKLDEQSEKLISHIEENEEKFRLRMAMNYEKAKENLRENTINSPAFKNVIDEFTPTITNSTGITSKDDFDKLDMGYSGYLRLFMLMNLSKEKKIENIQKMIQLNKKTDTKMEPDNNFKMTNSYVNLYADVNCSIKNIFISQAFSKNYLSANNIATSNLNRYNFSIHSHLSY